MPDSFSPSRDFDERLSRTTQNPVEPYGERCLSSAAKLVSSIDSDDDCSIISELSCDVEHYIRDNLMMHIDPITPPLEMQDSRPTAEYCTLLDRGTATVISSARSTPFTDLSFYDSVDRTMSTSSSVVDIISLHRLSFVTQLGSYGSDHLVAPFLRANVGSNHFATLPDELVCTISCYLDVESLSRTRLVSKRLLNLVSRDEAGWRRHCEMLWSQKAHVSREAYSLLENGNARKAFYFAGREAVSRHEVAAEELCFDPITGNGIIWSFRFKEAAGSDWWEPWWSGGDARQMVFLDHGTVMQYLSGCPQDDRLLADKSTERRQFRLVPPFHEARGETPVGTDEMGAILASDSIDVRWRFVSQPMDLPLRPNGAYIRLTIGGRDVPTYVVHRSPTKNWGFVMESCWSVYASFPLPRRRHMNDTAPGEGAQRPARMRLRRTTNGVARWFNVADMESEDEEENDIASSPQALHDLTDSALSVTTLFQWREALLYNAGAIRLPEGEGATAEFDRVWSQALRPAVSNHNAVMD